MRIVFIFLGFFLICSSCIAQSKSSNLWQRSYGGSLKDEAECVQQTSDGGFIIAGTSESTNGDITGNHGCTDLWVVKIAKSGDIEWQKSFGGTRYDYAKCIQQTSDGGYILVGNVNSNDGDVHGLHMYSDYWVVKMNATGVLQWQKCYGGFQSQEAQTIIQTLEGGYIIAGYTMSTDGDVTGNHGTWDVWIVKITSSGVLQWQKCFGGSIGDIAHSIQQTTDNGYIIAGASACLDGDVTGNHGYWDFWVIKTDVNGKLKWQKSYGGANEDYAKSIRQTTDGGYIIAGHTYSDDGDVTVNHGASDFWLVKTDADGVIKWQKTYGGTGEDKANCVQQTSDGGYILTGSTQSNDGDVSGNHGNKDYWLVKTNAYGTLEWQKCYGGKNDDIAQSVSQTTDDDFILAGYSESAEGDITSAKGNRDYWILRSCYTDPTTITISDPAYCYSTQLTASEGFEHYLWNIGDTTQVIEVGTGGLYSVTATNGMGCKSESEITVPDPIRANGNEEICLVTCDESTGKNVLVIQKMLDAHTDSIVIYRYNDSSGKYDAIGSLGMDQVSVFTDESATPAEGSYKYKIAAKNNYCGKESALSNAHHTIFLQALKDNTNKVSLSWNPYEGFGYSDFQILRSNTGAPFDLIAEVSANSNTFTDESPPGGANTYQVRVRPAAACLPSKAEYTYVSSNIKVPGTIGIDENKQKAVSIFPNPVSDFLTVQVREEFVGSLYTISDQTGRVVLSGKIASQVSGLDISEVSPGNYIFQLGNINKLSFKLVKK